jgi:AraC-like DNA-binding protein
MFSRYELPQPGTHFCVHFRARPSTGAVARLPLHWRPGAHGRWLSERLEEVTALQRQGEAAGAGLAHPAAGTLLQGLLLWLAVQTRPTAGNPGGRVSRVDADLEQVRSYLDAHQREPVLLPALAKRFGISQNYLARRFRQRHGMTIQRYLLSRRIDHARHLLMATELPLKAVAIEAGFGNPQYFHRQFVRMVGHNPSRERQLRAQ